MCGGISRIGTSKGMLKKVGSKTVTIGIANSKFDFLLWKNKNKSPLLNMT
jgi:hypothetical protein